ARRRRPVERAARAPLARDAPVDERGARTARRARLREAPRRPRPRTHHPHRDHALRAAYARALRPRRRRGRERAVRRRRSRRRRGRPRSARRYDVWSGGCDPYVTANCEPSLESGDGNALAGDVTVPNLPGPNCEASEIAEAFQSGSEIVP